MSFQALSWCFVHRNSGMISTMQINKTEMYWIMFFFHLEKKIDLETSFSTPIPLLTPPWTETTFSWFSTGLRKVHNYGEEVTSACKTNPVTNLTDSSPIRKYLLQSKSFLDVTTLLWLLLIVYPRTGTPFMRLLRDAI